MREHASTVLPGLKPRLFLADGLSESANYMTTYVDAIAPLVNVFDGYLMHSRFAASASLSQSPEPDIETPPILFVRDDLTVPVLTLESETDVLALGFLREAQPDSKMFRLWEVAGAAHGDSYLALNALDDDTTRGADLAGFASMTSPACNIGTPAVFSRVQRRSAPLRVQHSTPRSHRLGPHRRSTAPRTTARGRHVDRTAHVQAGQERQRARRHSDPRRRRSTRHAVGIAPRSCAVGVLFRFRTDPAIHTRQARCAVSNACCVRQSMAEGRDSRREGRVPPRTGCPQTRRRRHAERRTMSSTFQVAPEGNAMGLDQEASLREFLAE